MKIVYQRVDHASVTVDGEVISRIGKGALLFLAVEKGDTDEILKWGARKAADLRTFEDERQKMNLSLLDVGGEALVVSQFTLAGNTNKGRRPSFYKAESPAVAEEKYEFFCQQLQGCGVPVRTGRFAAMMDVELCNSGPVTLLIEKRSDED
jgi:D-tyrosyl-tRNA(Tyr) deacylase